MPVYQSSANLISKTRIPIFTHLFNNFIEQLLWAIAMGVLKGCLVSENLMVNKIKSLPQDAQLKKQPVN